MSMSRSMAHACARALCTITLLSVAHGHESAHADSGPSMSVEGVADPLTSQRDPLDGGDHTPVINPVAPQAEGTAMGTPQGAYIAAVRANGTGCPAGTWDANLSPDGKTFGLTFSEFYVALDPDRSVAVKDCMVSLDLHSPVDLAYTLDGVTFDGYSYLEDGVQARVQTSYFFQGHPDQGRTLSTDAVGPQDEAFSVMDTREDVSPVRSRCGVDQTLNIVARLRLLNSKSPRRSGFVMLQEIPAQSFVVSWKRC